MAAPLPQTKLTPTGVNIKDDVARGIFARNVTASSLVAADAMFPYAARRMKSAPVLGEMFPHRMLLADILTVTKGLLPHQSSFTRSFVRFLADVDALCRPGHPGLSTGDGVVAIYRLRMMVRHAVDLAVDQTPLPPQYGELKLVTALVSVESFQAAKAIRSQVQPRPPSRELLEELEDEVSVVERAPAVPDDVISISTSEAPPSPPMDDLDAVLESCFTPKKPLAKRRPKKAPAVAKQDPDSGSKVARPPRQQLGAAQISALVAAAFPSAPSPAQFAKLNAALKKKRMNKGKDE